MRIITSPPDELEGWYYPRGDNWWGKIHRSLNDYIDSFNTPNKMLCVEVDTNKDKTDDICKFIRDNINKLRDEFPICYICDYGFMLRDKRPDIRVIIIEMYAKR